MEVAAGVAATSRSGVSLPMASAQSPSRKEWRVVSEHPGRNAGNEELERARLGQADERVIYEKLHNLARQREELQQMEMDLRAQMIAKSEIMEMQNRYDAQLQEQSHIAAKLQEQLRDREQTIHELERKMEDKERELQAVRLDNEAAWAKEDLLREQNKELANFRRERDTIEAERAHHMKQLHDLQEHIQEKERQLIELQEQHRVARETIIYKDEQLSQAQAWVARVQEMDALQSSTNHSLQAELRERTEQYNQLWIGWQRQFAEMERLHMQTIQRLQLELATAREKSGVHNDESRISQTNANDGSQLGENSGNYLEANGTAAPSANSGGFPPGNSDNSQSFVSSGNTSVQINHVSGVPLTHPSILGMSTYLPPGQVTSLHHPYVIHPQGANHSVSHVPQTTPVGQIHSAAAMSTFQPWQTQQPAAEGSQMSTQSQYPPSQTEENSSRPESNYGYEFSATGLVVGPDYINVHDSKGKEHDSTNLSTKVTDTMDNGYPIGPQSQQNEQQISSQFQNALRLEALEQSSGIKARENDTINLADDDTETQSVTIEQPSSAASPSPSETSLVNAADAVLSEAYISSAKTVPLPTGKSLDSTLLDERSLLACIVRTIPAGGRIHISSTLPNRLAKMLAPLHWHDYKKKYGKLDDFVAGHPELFVIEGDYIQLREGAQGIIAATAAVAKVAAAAAASSPYSSSFFPSVAVTPMAQSNRTKKIPSMESRPIRNPVDSAAYASNGASFNAVGASNVKILSKSKDPLEFNGPAENGANAQIKGSIQGRVGGANFVSKPQGRTSAAAAAAAAIGSRR